MVGAPLGKTTAAAVMPLSGAGVVLPSGHPAQTDVGLGVVVVTVVNAPGRGCAEAEAAMNKAQSVSQILMLGLSPTESPRQSPSPYRLSP